MIAYSSNCLISQGWLASIAEGDSKINATLLYFTLSVVRDYMLNDNNLHSGIFLLVVEITHSLVHLSVLNIDI